MYDALNKVYNAVRLEMPTYNMTKLMVFEILIIYCVVICM